MIYILTMFDSILVKTTSNWREYETKAGGQERVVPVLPRVYLWPINHPSCELLAKQEAATALGR
jgi:hypothetical protein